MSGYVCPHCAECTNVWGKGGGESLAEREGIPFLGRVPIDPALVRLLDDAREEAEHDAASADAAGATALTYATIRRYRSSSTYTLFQAITEAVRTYTP